MRIRIDLAYDGAGFRGWAVQPGLRTVQGELQGALATVLRLPEVTVVVAGRTDAGVHARGQVVHADLPDDAVGTIGGRAGVTPYDALLRRLNGLLGTEVRVRGLAPAADGFDARFSAEWRRYAYRIVDAPRPVDPLVRGHVVAWRRPLDLDVMNLAARPLIGLHDFASFCRRREGATTLRTLMELTWSRDDAGVAVATVRADAFCHAMVRSMLGCLLAVGDGGQPPDWAGRILSAAVRDPLVKVAPAHGLTLEEVRYPADADVTAQAARTRRRRA